MNTDKQEIEGDRLNQACFNPFVSFLKRMNQTRKETEEERESEKEKKKKLLKQMAAGICSVAHIVLINSKMFHYY